MLVSASGLMIGSVSIGFLSDFYKKRRRPIIIVLLLYNLIWVSLLFLPKDNLPVFYFYILCFLMGICASGVVPLHAYAKEISNPKFTGLATSTANMGIFTGIAFTQSMFGYLLDYRWDGLLIEGAKQYTLSGFRSGFFLCFSLCFGSFILSLFLKETEGTSIFYDSYPASNLDQ